MCGIAGYWSTGPLSEKRRQALAVLFPATLALMAHRGMDATGAFTLGSRGHVSMWKGPGPAWQNWGDLAKLARGCTSDRPVTIGHVRLATHGSAAINNNNHPHRVGHVVGVHNGVFVAYDDLRYKLNTEGFLREGYQNDMPGFAPDAIHLNGECDSELLFALLNACQTEDQQLDLLRALNSMNRLVWYDDRMHRLYGYSADGTNLVMGRIGMDAMAIASEAAGLPLQTQGTWQAEARVTYVLTSRGTDTRNTATLTMPKAVAYTIEELKRKPTTFAYSGGWGWEDDMPLGSTLWNTWQDSNKQANTAETGGYERWDKYKLTRKARKQQSRRFRGGGVADGAGHIVAS